MDTSGPEYGTGIAGTPASFMPCAKRDIHILSTGYAQFMHTLCTGLGCITMDTLRLSTAYTQLINSLYTGYAQDTHTPLGLAWQPGARTSTSGVHPHTLPAITRGCE